MLKFGRSKKKATSTPASTSDSGQNQVSSLDFESQVYATGETILQGMKADDKSMFNKDWWYGRIMDSSMQNEEFKTQLFRFVDVLPYLHSGSEVARHLKEYFAEGGDDLPSVFNYGVGLGSLAPGLLAGAVKKNVTQMAKMFITGESPQDALPSLKKARKNNLCFTIDLLGEATLSEAEALEYQERYQEMIEWLAADSESWPHNPLIDEDENGKIPRVNVSVKITSLYSQIHEQAWEHSKQQVKQRLRPILSKAIEKNVFINIDMEQFAHKDFTIETFKELLIEPDFKDYPHFGIVIQAYLRDSSKDVDSLVSFAKARQCPITIRLVKGAYWDFEVIHAKQKGWEIPVYTNKAESDANFEICAQKLIDGYPHIKLALGSHNVRSIAAALVYAENKKLPKKAIELQMLYGMADPIKKSVINQGYRVREYATVGEMIPGMAYLVRRLLENTSNEGWLKNKFADGTSNEKLLADPAKGLKTTSAAFIKKPGLFYNHEPLDFAKTEAREKMQAALDAISSAGPLPVPVAVNGKTSNSTEIVERVNPSQSDQVVAKVSYASAEQANAAVESAKLAFKKWSNTPADQRAQILDKAADIMAERRFELSAIEILEVGKTWAEADGDIIEAIDFCRFYAKEMRKLDQPFRTGHAPGELSLYQYCSVGVAAVIAPWNFPLAILAGMTTSCLVAGNTVVMKPAEQSSLIAYKLYEILREAGVPSDVLHFLPGRGEVVGETLTSHIDVDIVSFTGSQDVGLQILQKASQFKPGQARIKKTVLELGGKNAVIIDSDADLDEAVDGVIYSAFGFQGQKCSACSRAIVLEGIYDRFVNRLIESAKSLHVGKSNLPETYVGPVVDQEAADRINGFIDRAKQSSKMAFQAAAPESGSFVGPTIFVDVDPTSELAQEEIFGPVLSVIKVKDLSEALEVANGTRYALTGGLFSRSPANIETVKSEFQVGNLYINRGNTGAIVERHPFGGFKMSGVGQKTGGPEYLQQFLEAKVVTENTMRRGFAPPSEDDD
ncbi:MAG: bifunctional proline dehydrogenase/L-glutamate gamma-semialdehyde dehydrogenase [Bdellovibrionales bacterium]|nr:bifunctional proline dehydrogenase/L-glutamate gamma-semialdehyde dehydrogenase [Bdellovibrionales bacterium]